MAKRNRKVSKKMSVNMMVATHLGAVIFFVFVMVIVNSLASSNCRQTLKRIGECQKELARLEDAHERASTHWEEMKTPDKVEAALFRFGLSMKPPRPEQNVHMNSNGQPYPGQISVAAAQKRRAAGLSIAAVAPVASRVRSGKKGR